MAIANLIIRNARLHSFHQGWEENQADTLAISGNKIEAVGKWEFLQPLIGPQTEVLDGRGKTLLPGFNDTHIHIWKVGNLRTYMLDVRAAGSLEEMLQMLDQYARAYPEAPWITARGFNEAGWEKGQMPTSDDLDRVIPSRPVFVIRTCAHIAVANSRAMQISGIDQTTPAPVGGMIYRNHAGKLNGIFSETALGLISGHIPPYNSFQLKKMIEAAREQLYAKGITAATDPAVDPLLLDTYREMDSNGELGFRLNAIPILLPDGGGRPYPVGDCFSSSFMQVNMVKFFSDGGLSGKTSALKGYYKNSHEQGVLRLDRDQFRALGKQAMAKGFGIATHAIGDAAIEFVIEEYKQLGAQFPGIMKRIEHLGLPEKKHLVDMSAYHIAASMQTIFISELGKNFIKYLGQEYLDHCYPVRSVLEHGILMALSSDAPVVREFNPFKGMEAAITRRDNEGNIIAAHESIGIREALKAYTSDAAALSGTPLIGALKEGMLADFIVIDGDPLETKPEQLTGIRVEKTYVNGKCVWEKNP